MKVAIVGSRVYTNKRKIFDFVGLCKNEFKSDLEIVSGGCPDGADRYAREAALQLGVKYVEFPPCHQSWNPWCKKPPYLYDKEYKVANFFMRNKEIAEYADRVVAFVPDGEEARGTMDTIRHAKKLEKPYIIVD